VTPTSFARKQILALVDAFLERDAFTRRADEK